MGLAVSLELPLLIIDIQRGGPSTGLPTKTEAADLLHGHVRPPRRVADADRGRLQPVPLLRRGHRGGPHRAASTARRSSCCRDGYLANGSEPWRLPDVDALPDISVAFATEPNHIDADGNPEFWPYLRDPETLARPLGRPGHARPDAPHRRHREGGRHAATSPTTRPTTSAWSTCGPTRSPASPDDPRGRVVGDVDDAEILVLGWGAIVTLLGSGSYCCLIHYRRRLL